MDKLKIICVTPIKNEAWTLDRFIQCASLWADHIIIADQNSTDGSQEIARRYPKVTLIENPSPVYDEGARQALLLNAARQIPGDHLIIALDADEMLTANWSTSSEWQQILQAPKGTVLYFQWVNVMPGCASGWLCETKLPFGFVDDGSDHSGQAIHSKRIPLPEKAPSIALQDIRVLHYQYTDWDRMESKQRWYQCWERINNPTKRPIQIYRQYRHMYGVDSSEVQPLKPEWLAEYGEQGVDMTTIQPRAFYYWDRELLDLFSKYGIDRFRKLDVWQADWQEISQQMGYEGQQIEPLADPRSSFEKSVHAWLKQTQKDSKRWTTRLVQNLLRIFGW